MGSFYATCSITNQTICDGQEIYAQFLLPSIFASKDKTIGELFVNSFLKVAKEKGIDDALKSFEKSTSTWNDESKLVSKGLMVSNDSPYEKWAPFGPAIRGYYDDCGNITPAEDEDSLNRVKILENLMGFLPFDTIMTCATDTRWFTLGLGEYGDTEDNMWKPKGISKDMPKWQLILCQNLSITYFHASVYNELINPNFSAEEKDGVMKSKYGIEWRNKYIGPIKEQFPKLLKNIKESSKTDKINWEHYDIVRTIGTLRCLKNKLLLIYLSCLARENPPLDWFFETINLTYSLSEMCVSLNQSQYGSQHQNWFGWKRIYNTLNPKIEETIKKYGID